ncbi:hypothetical protein BDV10DRAFT_45817 [Aspergillus recurvatus]
MDGWILCFCLTLLQLLCFLFTVIVFLRLHFFSCSFCMRTSLNLCILIDFPVDLNPASTYLLENLAIRLPFLAVTVLIQKNFSWRLGLCILSTSTLP